MQITVLCSSIDHPIWPRLVDWCSRNQANLVSELCDVGSGDLLFLISCNEIVKKPVRERFRKVLVIHASDVPYGRGFAPLNWQIIEGKSEIVVTLMEAADKVDSGDVWKKHTMRFEGHELFHEMFEELFRVELMLMDFAVANSTSITPVAQSKIEESYYRRRRPEDNEIVPTQSIGEIFDLVRAADPKRYPAHFEHRGHRYAVTLRKIPKP
jgi:methionyl-tRNA formyltransferase